MFADIRTFIEATKSSLFRFPHLSSLEASRRDTQPSNTSVTGQHSEDVGQLTSGFNYVDAQISCKDYDKFACPLLYS